MLADVRDVVTWQALQELADVRVIRDVGGRLRVVQGRGGYGVLRAGWTGVKREPPPSRAIHAGAIVHTRDAWWAPWRPQLRTVPVPFTLVSTFHDSAITDRAVEELMGGGSPVRAWFGVQVMATDPRVTRMPVGADPETVQVMARTLRRRPEARDVPLYVNFKPRNAERVALRASFPWAVHESWAVDSTPRYVERLGRARYVLSPPGRGWDCYRTYEALAMGAIPIVRRAGPESTVVDNLPVLVVDDWSEVTRERLDAEYPRLSSPHWDLTRLTRAYWTERIRHAAQSEANQAPVGRDPEGQVAEAASA